MTVLALVGCGFAAGTAWRHGLWGLLTGALLAALWLGIAGWWDDLWPRGAGAGPEAQHPRAGGPSPDRLLLDAAPTPMVAVGVGSVRALNRAARRLFATDDRVVAPPAALADAGASHLTYEGRSWRADRVMLAGDGMVVALIDIGAEERAAEARAAAELMQVLGHELMNGLAPIASLAESGLAALDDPAPDRALLREVMATLARRAEGLRRFTECYRALARLPAPAVRPVPLRDVADDLALLFRGQWPGVALAARADAGTWPLDRDQVTQALWALMQNAAEAATAAMGAEAAVTLVLTRDGDTLEAAVGDNGAGVDPAAAERIFRAFHTTKADGTGIGLSLARQIAHGHGGTLTLGAARPTTFRMTLPGG